MTEEEKQPQVKEETAEEESSKKQVVLGDPDPVEPVRDEITIDDFTKIDMRVCKILKCAEIRCV